MGIRSDVLAILRGGRSERIPWTIYAPQLFRGEVERGLRNRRLGMVRSWPVHQETSPHVEVATRTEWEEGRQYTRRIYNTPVGSVSERVTIPPSYYNEGSQSQWITEYMIKKPDDYDVVRFMIEDVEYTEDHEGFERVQRRFGEDGLPLARMGRCPLQRLLIEMAGLERISYDLYDCPNRVEDLLQVMEERQEEVYRIGASSSAELIWSPDNISTTRTSPEWFEKYVLPFYNRRAQTVHEAGKLYVSHMDGALKGIKHLVAKCDLDVIEAVTPPPMGNLAIEEARQAWPGKAIWMNFPESLFLEGDAVVYERALEILRQDFSMGRFVLGLTEDYPEERMAGALGAIARAVETFEGEWGEVKRT